MSHKDVVDVDFVETPKTDKQEQSKAYPVGNKLAGTDSEWGTEVPTKAEIEEIMAKNEAEESALQDENDASFLDGIANLKETYISGSNPTSRDSTFSDIEADSRVARALKGNAKINPKSWIGSIVRKEQELKFFQGMQMTRMALAVRSACQAMQDPYYAAS